MDNTKIGRGIQLRRYSPEVEHSTDCALDGTDSFHCRLALIGPDTPFTGTPLFRFDHEAEPEGGEGTGA